MLLLNQLPLEGGDNIVLNKGKIEDLMRGNPGKYVTIRIDFDDVVTLQCYSRYDPSLCKEKDNFVRVIRKAEVQNPDGSWSPYPTLSFLDGVEYTEQLMTRVLFRDGDGNISISSSTDGVPDGMLELAAQQVGILIEDV